MKKIAIVALIMIISSMFNQISAQKVIDFEYFPRHEIVLHYGSPSVVELTSVLKSQKFDNNIVGKGKKLRMTGSAGFGYNFGINPNVSIGVFGGYSSVGSDMIRDDSGDKGTLLYSTDITSYLGMLSGHWLFLREGALEISSGVYVGAVYNSQKITNVSNKSIAPKDETKVTFAYHLTALKVRYGETFAVFGELGFGHRGILNVGVSIKF